MRKGITEYSKDFAGERANHDQTSRFDMTDGMLGISQWTGKEIVGVNGVLLTKKQTAQLLKFIKENS